MNLDTAINISYLIVSINCTIIEWINYQVFIDD